MSEQISLEGKSVWVALFLALGICGLHGLGHLYLGQKTKGIVFTVLGLVLYSVGFGFVIGIIAAWDLWSLKDKIEAGETIGEKEHGLDFLSKLPVIN